MITREELERDRADILTQMNRLQGALSYINQKIAVLDKLEKKGAKESQESQESEETVEIKP